MRRNAPAPISRRCSIALESRRLNLGARRDLSRKYGAGRKQPLTAATGALVIVEEIERAIAQFHQRNIGWRTHIERAAVVEAREQARGVHGRAGDDLAERHAEHD